VFSIEMLPAQQGDCLWIEYGDPRRPHRVLVDGGTPPTVVPLRERIERLRRDDRHFDLIAVTHIDTDHIGGILKLLSEPGLGISTDDFWLNAWPQLPGTRPDDRLGPIDGEVLHRFIEAARMPWNRASGGAAIVVPDDPRRPLPSLTLAGGMVLTVLSPVTAGLAALRARWRRVLHAAGLDGPDLEAGLARVMARKGVTRPDLLGDTTPDVESDAGSRFTSDRAVANSTSIAVLAEVDGRRALFAGDAWAPVLESGIRRLLLERGLDVLDLDVLKLAHHGSRNNTSETLLEAVRCSRFLFSSSGAIFHHPDRVAVARAIRAAGDPVGPGATLYFNYRSDENEIWDDPALRRRYRYEAVYPPADRDGHLRVEV
jgi:Metallo-beta-lactamase superfamily